MSDKKIGVDVAPQDGIIDYYNADVVTATDYAPFGSILAGRNYNAPGAKDARFGFNGKENDNEVKGEGNQQDYGFRIYDPRLGRFLSVDPITKSYPWCTPYQFAGNKPIWCIDLDGLEDIPATGSNYPQPFSTEQLIKWATNDGFYKGPQSRGETVLLIQDYRVIENVTNRVVNIHKEIVLFQGDLNKPITRILQGNVTFAENGNTGPGRGPQMTGGGTIQFGTPEFKIQIGKLYPDGIPVNDVSITFGDNSRKLTDEGQVIKTLKPIADFLNAYPETKINISGNTNLTVPPSSTISSDNENISVQQLMDGRSQTLNKVLTEKLKVNPTQVNTTPGTQGTNTNGNIKVIQPKAETKEKNKSG